MKFISPLRIASLGGCFALACALLTPTTSHANVYATDIKVVGTLAKGPVPVPQNSGSYITYILNEAATAGVTINIQAGGTNTRTISITSAAGAGGTGTAKGLNTVAWDGNDLNGAPVGAGNYSFSITAAATGYTVWTQTSSDTAAGVPAHYPQGIDVDKNTNSLYYGRVIFGCALHTGTVNVPAAGMQTGLFKCNSDGSQADEGWYGNAGYLADDGGSTAVAGQMPDAGGVDPLKIRIGDDDRIYWVDKSHLGVVVASDMRATTNQPICSDGGKDVGPSITGMPDWNLAAFGYEEFDITAMGTTNAALWLADNDFPNWGIWMFHMTNGVVDTNDAQGTQAVYAGEGSTLTLGSFGGCMVDTNLDIFVSQNRNNAGDVTARAFDFNYWNSGVLPAENSQFNYSDLSSLWAVGNSDNSFEQGRDIVINSRNNPTIAAVPMANGASYSSGKTGAGIRLLNVADGSVVTVTNGSTVTTYTNLDNGEIYTCAAFDNVGNLYAASTQRNLWRQWSPPGANSSTTVALELLAVQPVAPSVTFTNSTFSVGASSNAPVLTATYLASGPLSVQWYSVDGNNNTNAVVGQTSGTAPFTTLALSNVQLSQNGYKYFVVISNALGTAVSSSATLTVTAPTASLAATTFNGDANGNSTTITATANGTTPTFQWYSIDLSNNTNPVSGATNISLTLSNLTASQNGYKYFVVASWTYAASVSTTSATLTVFNSPVITTQPTPLTEYVPVGYSDTLHIAGTGALPLQYQWYTNGVAATGATNSSFTFAAGSGTTQVYANLYNSVSPSGVNSSVATVIAPPSALSFASTTGVNASTGWDLNGGATLSAAGVLQLTTAATSQARSAFYALGELNINGFIASFTYIPATGTATRADGATFCIQTKGPTALGAGGGSLAVSTITPSVELEMNIYASAAGGIGISLNNNGAIGPNGPTGSVNINSLDPINVTMVYSPASTNIEVDLTDATTLATYKTNYTGASANITNLLSGTAAWVGFTGATGGSDAAQTITNFLFQSTSTQALVPGALNNGNLPLSWNPGAFQLYKASSLQGPWTPAGGAVTTNLVTGQASTTVAPAGPSEFFTILPP